MDIEEDLLDIPIVKTVSEKFNIRPIFIAGGVLVLSCILILLGYFEKLLTDAIGILYPAYKSLKSLATKKTDDDKQWLTYWAVFALFAILDDFINFAYSSLFKLVFLVWLFSPTTRGASIIYKKVLKQLMAKYGDRIDAQLDKVKGGASKLTESAKDFVSDPDNIAKGIKIASDLTETSDKKED